MLILVRNWQTVIIALNCSYLDPEYFLRRQLTTASDVYAYGVVLLEIITGQEAIDHLRFEELNIIEWVDWPAAHTSSELSNLCETQSLYIHSFFGLFMQFNFLTQNMPLRIWCRWSRDSVMKGLRKLLIQHLEMIIIRRSWRWWRRLH